MSWSNKGFFLLDALLCVFIVSCLCILCFSIQALNVDYEEGYKDYQERSNEELEWILRDLNICECELNESD